MVKPKLNYKEFLVNTRPKMRPVSETRVSQFMYALYNEYKETKDLDFFWNEYKKFKSNYSVHVRWNVYRFFVDFLISIGKYEDAWKEWKIIQKEEWEGFKMEWSYRNEHQLYEIMKFEHLLGKSLVDGEGLYRIADKGNQLTKFGKNNKDNVLKMVKIIVSETSEFSFFERFYKKYPFLPKPSLKTLNKFDIDYYNSDTSHYYGVGFDSNPNAYLTKKNFSAPNFEVEYYSKFFNHKDKLQRWYENSFSKEIKFVHKHITKLSVEELENIMMELEVPDGVSKSNPYKKYKKDVIRYEILESVRKNHKIEFLYNYLYEKYRHLDDNTQVNIASDELVHAAISSEAGRILREAENKYRLHIGAKKIGESWISETELFYKLQQHFKEKVVVQHGRPNWLGRQHFDIWFPEENIAVEYQGAQHDKAVDYFGGEKAFLANQKRDLMKREKCKNNNCTLIEVRPGYDLKTVIKEIEKANK